MDELKKHLSTHRAGQVLDVLPEWIRLWIHYVRQRLLMRAMERFSLSRWMRVTWDLQMVQLVTNACKQYMERARAFEDYAAFAEQGNSIIKRLKTVGIQRPTQLMIVGGLED